MSVQGHNIRLGQVEIYAEEQGAGSPTLVFLHYWGGSRRSWSQVIATLSDRFRCIAIDLRGWGRSGRNTDDFSLLAQANDVQGVIEALKLKDFVLVGPRDLGERRNRAAIERELFHGQYTLSSKFDEELPAP